MTNVKYYFECPGQPFDTYRLILNISHVQMFLVQFEHNKTVHIEVYTVNKRYVTYCKVNSEWKIVNEDHRNK